MLFCLARFAATFERHARRSSLLLVPGDAKPAAVSLLARPVDVAIIFAAE
jgi:hypothetical protein